jgi:hypothetical protein
MGQKPQVVLFTYSDMASSGRGVQFTRAKHGAGWQPRPGGRPELSGHGHGHGQPASHGQASAASPAARPRATGHPPTTYLHTSQQAGCPGWQLGWRGRRAGQDQHPDGKTGPRGSTIPHVCQCNFWLLWGPLAWGFVTGGCVCLGLVCMRVTWSTRMIIRGRIRWAARRRIGAVVGGCALGVRRWRCRRVCGSRGLSAGFRVVGA